MALDCVAQSPVEVEGFCVKTPFAASLGFHDGEHVAACVVQAIVGDAVPWLRVIAINWNLQSNLGAVFEFPVSSPKLRVDLQGSGLGFVGHSYQIVNCDHFLYTARRRTATQLEQ